MNYHTTTPKILDTLILSFALVPTETHATTLDLFMIFVTQRKFYCHDSFDPIVLIKFILLSIYNTQSPNPTHTFHSSRKSSHLAFLHLQKAYVHFLNLHQISFPSPHLLASLKPFCHSSCRNLIHTTHEKFSLSNTDCAPS
jgi:hypothetical protein